MKEKRNVNGLVNGLAVPMFLASFCLLFAATACEDETDGGEPGLSCQFDAVCDQFNGDVWSPELAETMCTRLYENDEGMWLEGSVEEEACPKSDAVGTCSFDEGGMFEVVSYYYSPFDADNAEEDCDLRDGSWND